MEEIRTYFNAERIESLFFIAVGLAAIAVALYCLLSLHKPFYSGFSYPLIAIALIQIAVGTSVYLRAPKDIQRVEQMVALQKAQVGTVEIPRMQTVMRNFVIYRYIEIALMALGLAVVLTFPAGTAWKGCGAGLLLQSGLMLALDFLAEARGKTYLEYLQRLGA